MARKTKMNNITSPKLLAQVNPKNTALLKDFEDYLRSIQRSETTIAGYENDIQIAWVWSLQFNDNAFYIDWKKRQIVKFQNWLINDNGNSPARVRRIKSTLSSLGNYIENVLDDEYPDFRNIIRKIESPVNQPVREPAIWTNEELQDLLDKLVEKKQYEKACYLALGLSSGRRKSELCRFRVSDFDDDKLVCGGALYKSDPIKTKGRGKGKFVPCYTLAKKFKPYFDLWMEERKEKGIESKWLFPKNEPGDEDEHIGISTANSWATTFDKMSDKNWYTHMLRHFWTTELYKAGIPESVIQALQSWQDIGMVSVYNDSSADEQIEMYFKDGDIVVPQKKDLGEI